LENILTSDKFLPSIFVNKFNDADGKLKKICEKAWEHQADILKGAANIGKMHGGPIMTEIANAFDSQSYTERISAMNAFQAFIPLTNSEEFVSKVMVKVMGLICGKYFLGKEKIVTVLTGML